MSYYENFIKEIISKSESKKWREARDEWVISDVWEADDLSGHCICGKEDCRYQFEIYNTINGNELFPLGSECIKKFERQDFNETVKQTSEVYRLAHACNKSGRVSLDMFSRRLISVFYYEDWLKPNKYNDYDAYNDYLFLLEMFNRRIPMTFKQKRKVQAILRESIIPNLKKLLNE